MSSLPLALTTQMVLNGEIKTKGVQIPTDRHIYEPILKALEGYGVVFRGVSILDCSIWDFKHII